MSIRHHLRFQNNLLFQTQPWEKNRVKCSITVAGGVIAVVALLGCGPDVASVTGDLTRPTAAARHHGDIVDVKFTADSKALFGRALPAGKDPAARPRVGEYVLWEVASGRELWRRPPDEKILWYVPGTADGKHWSAFGHFGNSVNRYVLMEFDTDRRVVEIPDVPGPSSTVTRPHFTPNFTHLAYSDYPKNNTGRQAHVFSRQGNGWKKLVAVPGEHPRLSPDGRGVVTVSRGDGIGELILRLWSVPDGKALWGAKCGTYGLVGFTADGKYVVQDDQIDWKLYDAATGRRRLTLALSKPFLAAYAEGKVLTVGRLKENDDLAVVTWEVESGQEVCRRLLPPGASITRTENAPFSAPRVAVVRRTEQRTIPSTAQASITVHTIDVFDPSKAVPLTTVKVASLSQVLLSPDGHTLAAITYGGPHFFHLFGQ